MYVQQAKWFDLQHVRQGGEGKLMATGSSTCSVIFLAEIHLVSWGLHFWVNIPHSEMNGKIVNLP